MEDISDRHENTGDENAEDEVRGRREFLRKCGKYAVVVPPAMVLLLSRDANANAVCNGFSASACDTLSTEY